MILKEDSILKFLPKNINAKQLMIFDSIRFVLETIDFNYENIISETKKISYKTEHYSKIPLFSYSWNFINYIAILRKLYKKLPSESNYDIIKEMFKVVPPRNTFQHIDERIDEFLFQNKEPFFGSIKWVFKNETTNRTENIITISGLHTSNYFSSKSFTVSEYSNKMPIISEIVLSTVTYHKKGSQNNIEIDISYLYEYLIKFVNTLEKHLDNVVKQNKLQLKNWKIERDMTLRILNNPK